MEYDNKNRGVLFKNDKKESEKHADYKGSYTDANGEEHWVSAWIKTPKKGGDKFMSFVTTPKKDVHNKGMAQAQKTLGEQLTEIMEDDIPF